jgi:hypothetical protein
MIAAVAMMKAWMMAAVMTTAPLPWGRLAGLDKQQRAGKEGEQGGGGDGEREQGGEREQDEGEGAEVAREVLLCLQPLSTSWLSKKQVS